MLHRLVSPITHSRIGFRGGVLLVYGILEIIIGWAILNDARSPYMVFREGPAWTYAIIWLMPGFLSVVCSFFQGKMELIGYGISFIPFFLWGVGYLATGCTGEATIGTALRGASIYWAFMFLIRLTARWPEPQTVQDLTIRDLIETQNEIDAKKNGGATDDVHGDGNSPTAS